MPQLTFEAVAPLVAAEDVRGVTLNVTFQCPVSGKRVDASSNIEQGVLSKTKTVFGRQLMQSLRYSFSRMLYSLVGGGVAGSMASSAASQAVGTTAGAPASYTEDERRATVLAAFKRVQSQFAWDGQRFVSASLLKELQTEMARVVGAMALTEPWDRAVLARMLAEVAAADGRIADEERELFAAFAEGAELDQLLHREPLAVSELKETTPKVREALLMLTFALAQTDGAFGGSERGRIAGYAHAFGVSDRRAAELEAHARDFVVDQMLEAIYADGVCDAGERAQVEQLASGLGMDAEALGRLDARCRKRKGLL